MLFRSDIDKDFLNVPDRVLVGSKYLVPEIVSAGLDQYRQLYSYFWKLIGDANLCSKCKPGQSECLNRFFLSELKQSSLNESDLYVLTYITLFFLDLINYRLYTNNMVQSYYILSKGHDYVFKFLEKPKKRKGPKGRGVDQYNGYLLSVLYYMIPDFKYT